MPTLPWPRRVFRLLRSALAMAVGCACLLLPASYAWETPIAPGPSGEDRVGWRPLGGPPGRIGHLAVGGDGAAIYAVSVAFTFRGDDQTQRWANGRPARSDALYWSRDGGAGWQPLTNDLPPGPITALYADAGSGKLYVGMEGGLWAGTPAGGWQRLALPRDGLIVRRIARSADGRDLYLAGVGGAAATAGQLYRSADDGRTWTAIELPKEWPADDVLDDLLPAPDDPRRLYLTTRGNRLFRSEDGGATWTLLRGPDEGATALPARPPRLAIGPDRPQMLVWAQSSPAGGIVLERSDDGGAHWRALPSVGFSASAGVNALSVLRNGILLLNSPEGTFRSADGGASWQPLEGALRSGGVAHFLLWPERVPLPAAVGGRQGEAVADEQIVFAATGYGVFLSRDGGALWQPRNNGLPVNSRIAGLLANPKQPGQLWALMDTRYLAGTPAPPAVLRSTDGGQSWSPAAAGLGEIVALAWTSDPAAPDRLMIAGREHFATSEDGGRTWQVRPLPPGNHVALAVAPSDPRIIYLAGWPALRSRDRGQSWEPMPVAKPGQSEQTSAAMGLAVDGADADHVWAGMEDGVYESTDGGRTWRPAGLEGKLVRWLQAGADRPAVLYAGVEGEGIYRLERESGQWVAAVGLPAGSTILHLFQDGRRPGQLWAAADGGGVYSSADGGATWTNVAVGLGDNLARALAPDLASDKESRAGVLIGTANAGVWALRGADDGRDVALPPAVDARIELVWPHGGAAVTEAKRANIGLRLFGRNSLEPTPCTWSPRLTIWQAVDTNPAEPLEQATQRVVDGQPFPFWELNDVDVGRATDPAHKIYFMVKGDSFDLATGIWAHGADPRTYFPQQDVPSGLTTDPPDAIDARIQIVWPHDAAGVERPLAEATEANVAVLLFKHGTRLSVPVGWQPPGLILYGAWNHEVGRPLAREAVAGVRTSGAITYPVWEFNNIPVARGADPANRLFLWVAVEGIETHSNIWVHGADARTAFPVPDEPIRGCFP
ncbi:MAG: WD40/YVTN/BNR-like repeat-containing protein [Anaerolineae bacterium]